jgi:hypothetical protein
MEAWVCLEMRSQLWEAASVFLVENWVQLEAGLESLAGMLEFLEVVLVFLVDLGLSDWECRGSSWWRRRSSVGSGVGNPGGVTGAPGDWEGGVGVPQVVLGSGKTLMLFVQLVLLASISISRISCVPRPSGRSFLMAIRSRMICFELVERGLETSSGARRPPRRQRTARGSRPRRRPSRPGARLCPHRGGGVELVEEARP